MAVKLSREDIARLSPDAKRQLRTVQPEERPSAPAAPVRRTSRRRRISRKGAFAAGVGVGAVAGRSSRQVRSNLSPGSIFGMITGAALIGALVFRGNTVAGLLGHMTAYWQRVIALGRK